MKKNLKLRTEILDIALNIEDTLNLTLLTLLFIDKKEQKKRKAITNRSGNLSFVNKINLMFDLGLLNKAEHQKLLLLMIFRNQFLHNLECNSFKKAISLLGNDKGNKLLKFCSVDSTFNEEFRYSDAYRCLHLDCLKVLKSKIDNRSEELDRMFKTELKQHEYSLFLIDSSFDIFKRVLKLCEKYVSENLEFVSKNEGVLKILDAISKTILDGINNTSNSKKFKYLRSFFGKTHEKDYKLLVNKINSPKE